MSFKKYFGSKSKSVKLAPEATTPRSMEEIQKSYGEMCARAGGLQYRIFIDRKELAKTNEILEHLNLEGAARQALDAKAKEEAEQAAKEPQVVS
jgi:hypothetical protein